jgi:hypothetical protein
MPEPDGPPPVPGNAPDRPLAGIRDVDVAEVELTAELAERRAAVAELGDALRELTSSAIGTEVDIDVLRDVAAQTRALAARSPSDSDVSTSRRRSTTCTVGSGCSTRSSASATRWRRRCTWRSSTARRSGRAPSTGATRGRSPTPTVGSAPCCSTRSWATPSPRPGHPGVTGRLEVRYRATVPLGQPLRLQAKLVDVLGIRAAVTGSISLASAPDDALVEAEGRFLALRPEQATRLFGGNAEPTG